MSNETSFKLGSNGISINPFKDEAQTALFKDPVRTAL
jgi:hypothetical protein